MGTGFGTSLYHLYFSTIDLVGYPPSQGKFKPILLILKYVEYEPDFDDEDEDFDVLDYTEDNVQERLVAIPDHKVFVINNPLYIEEFYISGRMMPKIGFEIFHDETKRGYSSLAVRRKWEGYP